MIRIVYLKINRGFLPFPNYFNNTETPIFAIDITNLLSTLFDFSKIITDMDKDSNTSNSWDCRNSIYSYPPAGHVITGNLNSNPDSSVRNIISKDLI